MGILGGRFNKVPRIENSSKSDKLTNGIRYLGTFNTHSMINIYGPHYGNNVSSN